MKQIIKRKRNDIFSFPLLGFMFKNAKFLFVLKFIVFSLFIYAIYFGFIYETKSENRFTTGLFWNLFWPFFMVVSLVTLGRVFCGICPHGFLGKYITKIGLNKKMPKFLANPFVNISVLLEH